jgi:ATP-dependent helicase HrpA
MTSIGLGDIAAFPFIDEPDKRSITDGLQLLTELGAIEAAKAGERHRRLTAVGGQARLRPRGDGDRGRAVDPGPA